MQRARYIKDPAVVLRLLLMHVGAGCSLAETAARWPGGWIGADQFGGRV